MNNRNPVYTDGTVVVEGDSIRYRQRPGGVLPASENWTYGVAAKRELAEGEREMMEAFNQEQGYVALNPDELLLKREEPVGGSSSDTRTAYYNLHSHIIEKVAT